MMRKLLVILFICLLSNTVFAETPADTSVHKVPPKGTIALTFDDGPSPTFTPQVLAILKKYHVKATFFLVGENAKMYPDLVKQIYADGHQVNSHSMTHPLLTKVSEAQLKNEIQSPVIIINDIIGVKPKCLRYPFGASNEHVRNEIREYGMTPVPMGFNSFDYEHPGTDKIISWVLKNAYSGQVILMHDGYERHEQTVAALPAIIEGIQKKGLGFGTIC